MKAFCSGCEPFKPSIVVTCAPRTCANGTRQEFTGNAVEEHRAGPALPLAAAFLGAGQAALLAQDVEQPLHRMSGDV